MLVCRLRVVVDSRFKCAKFACSKLFWRLPVLSFWNQFTVLAVRKKIATWFQVGASFCLYAFSISTAKSFTQTPFSLCLSLPLSSPLSACFIFLFSPHFSPALKVIDSAIYQRKCLQRKERWKDMKGCQRPWGSIHTYTMTGGSRKSPGFNVLVFNPCNLFRPRITFKVNCLLCCLLCVVWFCVV